MANHIVYAYGTLREGRVANVEKIKGAMYDIGSFPGIILGSLPCPAHQRDVIAERIVVTDEELKEIDAYEGYVPGNIAQSLFLRVRFRDGWIYTFNRPVEGYPLIESGDWCAHAVNR